MSAIGIVGGGAMGAGIALVSATHGNRTRLLDIDSTVTGQAVEKIKSQIDRLVEKQKLSAAAGCQAKERLHASAAPSDLSDCDVVIEAVVENLDLKIQTLTPIVKTARSDTIFASNTSSLSISEMGDALGIPERFCGMHFFNPAPVMPLVEIIAGRNSDPQNIERLLQLATRWDKTPVRVKDTPGFIVNRVARPFYLEALRLVEEKIAGCDEIDDVMKKHGGFRMGPFELMDLIGLDVNYAVTQSVYEQSGRPARFKPSAIQAQLVAQKHLGRKTGRGFYDYEQEPPKLSHTVNTQPVSLNPTLATACKSFIHAGGWSLGMEQGYVLARILGNLMNEAALAEQEKIATENDIDVAMKLGTNYPKGLLAWADELGRDNVGRFLRLLDATTADHRFALSKRFNTGLVENVTI